MLRPNLAVLWVIYDLYIFFKLLKDKEYKKLICIIIFSLIGLFIAILPIIAYLYINNAIQDFIEIYLLFNIKYMGVKEDSLLITINYFRNQGIGFLIISCMITIISIFNSESDKNKKTLSILNSMVLLFSLYFLMSPQRLYIHYLITLIACFVIPTIYILDRINDKRYYDLFFITCFLLIILNLSNTKNRWNNQFDAISYIIQNYTEEEDNVLQLGNLTNIYLVADRQYQGKYFFQKPFLFYDEKIQKDFLEEIETNKPKLIIDAYPERKITPEDNQTTRIFKEKINNFLKENYDSINNVIYLKKESEL